MSPIEHTGFFVSKTKNLQSIYIVCMTDTWLVFKSVILLCYIMSLYSLRMILFSFFMWTLSCAFFFLRKFCIFVLLVTFILWIFFNALSPTKHLVFDVENTHYLYASPWACSEFSSLTSVCVWEGRVQLFVLCWNRCLYFIFLPCLYFFPLFDL